MLAEVDHTVLLFPAWKETFPSSLSFAEGLGVRAAVLWHVVVGTRVTPAQ